MKNVLKTIKVQGGKEYAEVHTRVNYFRSTEQFKGWGQDCEIIHQTDTSIIMKATIYYPDGRIASTGYAKEDIDGARINQRNHVEVCDTSAVGRALGFLGIGINQGSIASYEEVMNSKANEKIDALKDKELNLGIPNTKKKKKEVTPPTGDATVDIPIIQKLVKAKKTWDQIEEWLRLTYDDLTIEEYKNKYDE